MLRTANIPLHIALVSLVMESALSAAPTALTGVVIPSAAHAQVRTWLRAGDVVLADASRHAHSDDIGLPAPLFAPQRFDRELVRTAEILDDRIVRAVVFSSLEDAREHLSDVPAMFFTWIIYRCERPVTPRREWLNPHQSAPEFARLVHEAGFRAQWSPDFRLLDHTPRVTELAVLWDGVEFQHQDILRAAGVAAYLRATRRAVDRWKAANPKLQTTVRLDLSGADASQNASALWGLRGVVDRVALTADRVSLLTAALKRLRDSSSATAQPLP